MTLAYNDPEFGVKVEKVTDETDLPPLIVKDDSSPIPKNYIWKRGPEHQALDDTAEIIKPPAGYYKLDLEDSNTKLPGYTSWHESTQYYPWPYGDGTVLDVNIGTSICQLNSLDKFMDEVYRVLVPNGKLTIFAPYYTSRTYHSDTHNRIPITDDTFGFYNVKWAKAHNLKKVLECDFEYEHSTYFYSEEWLLRGDLAKDYARKFYWNVCESVKIILYAVKPMRKVE